MRSTSSNKNRKSENGYLKRAHEIITLLEIFRSFRGVSHTKRKKEFTQKKKVTKKE